MKKSNSKKGSVTHTSTGLEIAEIQATAEEPDTQQILGREEEPHAEELQGGEEEPDAEEIQDTEEESNGAADLVEGDWVAAS